MLEKVELEAGDCLACTYPGWLSPRAMENIRRGLQEAFPGHRILFFEEGLQLAVIKPAKTTSTMPPDAPANERGTDASTRMSSAGQEKLK